MDSITDSRNCKKVLRLLRDITELCTTGVFRRAIEDADVGELVNLHVLAACCDEALKSRQKDMLFELSINDFCLDKVKYARNGYFKSSTDVSSSNSVVDNAPANKEAEEEECDDAEQNIGEDQSVGEEASEMQDTPARAQVSKRSSSSVVDRSSTKAKRRKIANDILDSMDDIRRPYISNEMAKRCVTFFNTHPYHRTIESEKAQLELSVDLDDGVVLGDNGIVKRKKGLQYGIRLCSFSSQLSTANFITCVFISKAIILHRFGSDETLFVRDYVDLFFTEEEIARRGRSSIERFLEESSKLHQLYVSFPDIIHCQGITRNSVRGLLQYIPRFNSTVAGHEKVAAWREGQQIEMERGDDWTRRCSD